MVALAAQLLALFCAGQIQVTLAPDQPVPAVYIDEPLVVEFRSPVDTTCTVDFKVHVPGQNAHRISLTNIRLAAGRPRWVTVDTLPPFYGPHSVRVLIRERDAEIEIAAQFHRIARPTMSDTLPLCVNLDGFTEDLLYALRSVPVGALRLRTKDLDLLDKTQYAWNTEGYRIHVRADDGEDVGLENLKELSRSITHGVDLWELSTTEGPLRLLDMARAIRDGSPEAQVHAVVANAAELSEILSEDVYHEIEGAVVDAEGAALSTVGAFALAAERAGFEKYPLRWFPGVVGDEVGPHDYMQRLIAAVSNGVAAVCLDARDLYGEEGFGPHFDMVCTATRLLGAATYTGSIAGEEDVRGDVFRDWSPAGRGETWVMTLWGAKSDETPLSLPLDPSDGIEFLDAYGNPLPLTVDDEGTVSVQVIGLPRYLRGRGGSMLERAAAQELRRIAAEVLADTNLARNLDAETSAALKRLSGYKMGSDTRSEFLILLRSLPIIEWEWNQGTLDTAIAVPAMARLAGLSRHLALLEQQSGKPFLDPLEKTLSSCAGFQRRIHDESGRGHVSSPRTAWLMAEVSNLTAEARKLAALGRNIEAQAVAALAEWRARCLEVAGGPPYRPL